MKFLHKVITTLPDGRMIEVATPRLIPHIVVMLAKYEEATNLMKLAGVHNPKVVYDIGANIGTYSISYSLAWPDAKIFAIEPVEQNLEYLRHNTALFPNIEIIPLAIHNEAGTATMEMFSPEQLPDHKNVDKRPDWAIMSIHGDSGKYKQEVECTTIDELIGDGPVDFIKIDVEGNDFNALLGAQNILSVQRPGISVEVHTKALETSGASPEDVYLLMAAHRYARMYTVHINELFRPVRLIRQ